MFINLGLSMQGNGREDSEMAQEFRLGQIEQNMKEIGKKERLMEKENSHTLTEAVILETGKTIKQMALEYIVIKTEEFMRDFGRMIYRKGKALNDGLMDLVIKETM